MKAGCRVSFNPYDPTDAELVIWGHSPGGHYPDQDWAIVIAGQHRAELFLRLAADPAVVQQRSFLHFLYILAADVVRAGNGNDRLVRGIGPRAVRR